MTQGQSKGCSATGPSVAAAGVDRPMIAAREKTTFPGDRLESVTLGRLSFGVVEPVEIEDLFRGKRAIIVGVPGAFTPVCTREHLPQFVRGAARLRASGFDLILCLAPNDPWTTDVWARALDPDRAVQFLSDGNLDFARRIGALTSLRSLFLGERSARYLLQLSNGVVERFSMERDSLCLTCTGAEDVLL